MRMAIVSFVLSLIATLATMKPPTPAPPATEWFIVMRQQNDLYPYHRYWLVPSKYAQAIRWLHAFPACDCGGGPVFHEYRYLHDESNCGDPPRLTPATDPSGTRWLWLRDPQFDPLCMIVAPLGGECWCEWED